MMKITLYIIILAIFAGVLFLSRGGGPVECRRASLCPGSQGNAVRRGMDYPLPEEHRIL